MKKNIPKIRERESEAIIPGNGREREWNEKIHSHNSGKGIRGFHSWEWTGTGIPAHPCVQPLVLLIRERVPELALNAWYPDDGTLSGKVDQLREVMDILVMEGPARGLILSTADTVTAPAAQPRQPYGHHWERG